MAAVQEEQGDKVRAAHMERIRQLKTNMDGWEAKLKAAEEKREKERQKKLDALHEHVRCALLGRQGVRDTGIMGKMFIF